MVIGPHEWLEKKLPRLIETADKAKLIHPNIYYSVGAWSVLKLLVLSYYVSMYTRIIPKYIPKYFSKMYYIDLLAGAGLCKIRETGDVVAGSALVASTYCYNPFDEYLLVEADEKKARALDNRMKAVVPNAIVFQRDCNECIDEVLGRISKQAHYLAFVDCEGLEVNWSTMKELLGRPGDVWFTFQSRGAIRVVGRALGGSLGDRERLNTFFGDDGWETCDDPESLLNYYMEKLQKHRDLVKSIPIVGKRGYRYDLVLATRETKGGSPWLSAVFSIEEKVRNFGYEYVKEVLNVVTGRQKKLGNFLKSGMLYKGHPLQQLRLRKNNKFM